jgi:ribosome-associated translation inhibitor RaiA
MLIRTHIKNLTPPEKDQFEAYLPKKVEALKAILESHYPDEDTVKLDVHIQRHEKHTAFEVEYVLHLPRTHQPLVGSEVKHSVTEPMDKAIAKLESQVVKHFKKLARE